MGKASSSKKVARVARTGGGRTKRGSTSWFWPVFIGVVVVLGTAGIVQAKMERQPDTTPPRIPAEGRAGDHWHAALGFYICDDFLPDIADETDPLGIHTHNDGIVHIHPQRTAAAGRNARLGVFLDAVKGKVSETEIRLPGQDAKKDGDKCGDKPGRVQAKTWPSKEVPDAEGTVVTRDPSDIRFTDGQLITVAFVPEGAEIPKPRSAPNLDRLTDVPGATTVPPEAATTQPGTETTEPGTEGTAPPDGTPSPEGITPGADSPPPSDAAPAEPPPAEGPASPTPTP